MQTNELHLPAAETVLAPDARSDDPVECCGENILGLSRR